MKPAKIYIDPGVYFWSAFMLLAIPLPLLAAWLIAVTAHEAGHILAVFILGGRVEQINIRPSGAQILCDDMGLAQNVISTLSGPVFGLMPVFIHSVFPAAAVLSLILGVYNLLPFPQLDGGRILECYAGRYSRLSRLVKTIRILFAVILLQAAVWTRLPVFLLPVSGWLGEKFLANRRKKRYNSATIEMR